ncbi:hypothetical protein CLV98_11820 [Dyadobacter jejuensis]|uniref:Uncharacterized protein n=1 Tax=Dyadobacter jejuensis TaxID=1082580 RepID=A0A316AAM8_9BACT|nr:hypothetical protein [Dyadobacter jejuensis]PWJ54258.1 hypothetical protein CLV98_11820 [Dyadobacter jejuensis]
MSKKKKPKPELIKSQLTDNVHSIKDAFIDNVNEVLAGLDTDTDTPLKLSLVLNTKGVQSQTTLTYGRNKEGKCGFWPKEQWVGACLPPE